MTNKLEVLWKSYYDQKRFPVYFLPNIILTILSRTELNSRLLALLSLIIQKVPLHFSIPSNLKLRNRLGWLLEISGKTASFSPAVSTQNLLENTSRSEGMKKYFRNFQTSEGKKWKIYDCPLNQLKESLPWPQNWNE